MAGAVEAAIAQMSLLDLLDDLTVRFLLNLPPAELSSVPRLCFQVEEAQWFYEDFIRPANPSLPSLNLRQFCLTLFQHCPLLSGFNAAQHLAAYEEFLAYKVRVPVRGAILMDDSMEKVLLVRGWKKGASWSFPRGKINKDEKDLDCAIREVYEETGFDINAAGLVEFNQKGDGHVKAIDVTMREQHMKLFVFRGVPLDTYFEPKTRKEISKIQWYNVKDLPGFKKQKGVAGQGQGDAASTKFYMVAPFLGHLKKWIGQQRKKDLAATSEQHARSISVSNERVPAVIAEDLEEDTETGFTTDNIAQPVERSADELKRLLSIGMAPAVPTAPQQQSPGFPSQTGVHSNNLLAMLRGSQPAHVGGNIPHTPFEQVDPPVPKKEPETPQSHHPRQPSGSTPQQHYFNLQHASSPQRLQQEYLRQQQQQHYQQAQRHSSLFNASLAGPPSAPPQQQTFSNLPPHMQQDMFQQQRQQSVPTNFMPGNGVPRAQNPGLHSQFQQGPSNMQFSQGRPSSQGPPLGLQQFAGQVPSPLQQFASATVHQRPSSQHVPLGSEPAIPEPSKLPPPTLNAHSMKLLDVFRMGSSKPTSNASMFAGTHGQRAGSQQQNALLDLFRNPSVAPGSTASVEKEAIKMPASPTLTDVTEKPSTKRLGDRRPTLNEITRTLPLNLKPKSPVIPAAQVQDRAAGPVQNSKLQTSQPSAAVETKPRAVQQSAEPPVIEPPALTPTFDARDHRPKSRGHLFDPAKPQRAQHNSPQRKTSELLPPNKMAPQETKSPKPSPGASPRATNKPRTKHPRADNVQQRQPQPVPQFSILQRPGSARSPVSQGSFRNESLQSAFQPQVLKRPSEDPTEAQDTTQRRASIVHTPVAEVGKKDQLLALFGKTASPNPQPAPLPASKSIAATTESSDDSSQKSNLLNLFSGNKAEVTIRTPEPPPSPQILPERKPSSSGQRIHTSQQHLLSLFTKTSPSGMHSPNTPISPFTLGTPVGPVPSTRLPDTTYDSTAASSRGSESQSRLGSLTSSSLSNGGSGQQTPTESKDLLLGYLTGVIKKEGHRGAKRTT